MGESDFRCAPALGRFYSLNNKHRLDMSDYRPLTLIELTHVIFQYVRNCLIKWIVDYKDPIPIARFNYSNGLHRSDSLIAMPTILSDEYRFALCSRCQRMSRG
jgi:hypothetical protein